MKNCRRRQSSSVSVLLPTGDHNPSVSEGAVTVQQESIPAESCEAEIPRITFTIRNTSSGPRNWGPGGGDFFNCSTVREAVVSLYRFDGNLALLVILALWQPPKNADEVGLRCQLTYRVLSPHKRIVQAPLCYFCYISDT